jgi:hypothetical protein
MQFFALVRNALTHSKRAAAMILAVTGTLATHLPAHAENHALIMWIAHYAQGADLPGIDLDAQSARQIALAMGVPEANITELKNEQLTWRGMGQAIQAITDRIKQGDKVILYFSGHGAQQVNASGGSSKCSEGILAQDVQLYFDRNLEADLARLGAKASQVVMFNDSCFSGGASAKKLSKLVPKVYPGPINKQAAASGAEYNCGDAVNSKALSKNFEVVPRSGARLLYVAASAPNEVSYASPEGSIATVAWAACIKDPAADTNRSGSISGDELKACAQARINANKLNVRQTVTLTGTTALSVSFAEVSVANEGSQVAPNRALQDIRAGSDKSYKIGLKPAKSSVRIGEDSLQFDVDTNMDGYLYIFQIGSDGKSVNLLFPNAVDTDNRLPAGKHSFPRPTWALKAAGPAGVDHLMALLSSEPKNYADVTKRVGFFSSVPSTRSGIKSLIVVSTGAVAGGQGRYGTSEVMQVTETP